MSKKKGNVARHSDIAIDVLARSDEVATSSILPTCVLLVTCLRRIARLGIRGKAWCSYSERETCESKCNNGLFRGGLPS